MAWSKERATEYKNDFIRTAYDRINLTVPKGKKEEISQYAKSKGMSLNGYINQLIEQDMKQEH